ncbi:DeoR/GlpR family DNA-binding transcription regulator [Mycolicibacterium sp. CBM1]
MKAERLGEILDRLGDGGSVDVVRLAEEFQVSSATIRRDLQSLHEQGLVRRTPGGALPNPAGLEMPIRYKASRQLKQKRAIGIAAAELISRPNIRLIVVGGKARHASYELVGPAAEAMIAQYHFDIAFVGADGFTASGGCTTHDEMEAHTDLAFIQQAARTVLVADSSKIGKVTFARICGPEVIRTLVTDADIAEEDRLAAETRNLEVVVAGAK